MSTDTGTSLRISRVINAAPERVFRAWTDPADMRNWACPEGASVERAEADLVVGGRYAIHMRSEDGTAHTAVGVYREIDPPHRLVYTWDWNEPAMRVGETLVTVQFNDVNGSTEVVLTHDRFPTAEARDSHEQGWTSCIDRLERLFP
jgi:uncharacterized protein YndB with AHSA1/START domain